MSQIWGLLTAIPELLAMLNSFAAWVNKASGNDPAGFIKRAGVAFDLLAQAKTQEEHANAAKNIASLLSGLPPQ
jgi:hypothetical protein